LKLTPCRVLGITWCQFIRLFCLVVYDVLPPPRTLLFYSLLLQVAKNKIAPPFRVVEMDILFGTGIDTVSCLLDAAEDAGFFTRKGSWYSYEGKNISQVSAGVEVHGPGGCRPLRPL